MDRHRVKIGERGLASHTTKHTEEVVFQIQILIHDCVCVLVLLVKLTSYNEFVYYLCMPSELIVNHKCLISVLLSLC